jgi:hypothetical protein
MMEFKKVQLRRWLTTFHQIDTKDRKRRCCYTILVVVFNSFWINVKKILTKKRKKIKEGEQDDNAIATTAASCLLALVNGMDKSNKFNKLDEMQNHMSNLITKQTSSVVRGENNNKDSEKKKISQYWPQLRCAPNRIWSVNHNVCQHQ